MVEYSDSILHELDKVNCFLSNLSILTQVGNLTNNCTFIFKDLLTNLFDKVLSVYLLYIGGIPVCKMKSMK